VSSTTLNFYAESCSTCTHRAYRHASWFQNYGSISTITLHYYSQSSGAAAFLANHTLNPNRTSRMIISFQQRSDCDQT
jgi:hypothetical protein